MLRHADEHHAFLDSGNLSVENSHVNLENAHGAVNPFSGALIMIFLRANRVSPK